MIKVIDYLFDRHSKFFDDLKYEHLTSKEKIKNIYQYGIEEMVQFEPIFYSDLKKYYPQAFNEYKLRRKDLIFFKIKGVLESAQIEGEIAPNLNVNLFCELNLNKLDLILAESNMAKKFTPEILMHHTVGISLNGIFNN